MKNQKNMRLLPKNQPQKKRVRLLHKNQPQPWGGETAPQELASPKQQEQGVAIFPQEPTNRGRGMDSWVEERIINKQHKRIVSLLKQNIQLKRENKQLKQTIKS